jgi:DtxR family Mn-dependent transcriptional regulator
VIPRAREDVEEMAEEIWALSETGQNLYDRLTKGSKLPHPAPVFEIMVQEGLAQRDGERVRLSAHGEVIARAVVRRHRLAEILFSQVLAVREEISESTACEMEHILSVEVTDSVCTFLGHPPHCPHGKAIPRGRCCELFRKEVPPLVIPLPDLGVGESARIVFMTPGTKRSLERVANLGVIPGATLRLRQKHPSMVLEVGQTTVALDTRIAADLYVRRLSREDSSP